MAMSLVTLYSLLRAGRSEIKTFDVQAQVVKIKEKGIKNYKITKMPKIPSIKYFVNHHSIFCLTTGPKPPLK